jgi:biopolymer transport protein ExbD
MTKPTLGYFPGRRRIGAMMLTLLAFTFGSISFARTKVPQTQDRLLTTATALIVEVDARGNVQLNASGFGTTANSTRLVARLNEIFAARTRNLVFSDRDGATQTHIPLERRIAKKVSVIPDLRLAWPELLKLLRALRTTDTNLLSVELNPSDVSFPSSVELKPETSADADPHLLLVRMDAGRHITLNQEAMASLEALTEKLRAVFAQRRQDGVFAPGTNQIDQTVYFQIDPRLSVSDLTDLRQAIGHTYATPVILRLEDPPRTYADVPPARRTTPPTRRRHRRP